MTAFYMSRPALAAAALLAAIAAWLSLATPDGARIALVPISALAAAVAALAGLAVVVAARAGLSIAPFWLLTFVVLPWLPLPIPAAFLVWSGAIRWLIWTAVAVLVLMQVRR